MKNEIWRDVVGYEGLYKVSNFGRVKSLKFGKEKILNHGKAVQHNKNRDYIIHTIALCKNGKAKTILIHRLVWTTFHGNIPNNMDVDHIDNNPENNRLDNLQLLTRSENMKKVFIDNHKLNILYAKKIRCLNNGIIYESISEASRKLILSTGNIWGVLNGRLKNTKGYHFEYV